MQICPEQAVQVDELPRRQAHCNEWFAYKAGRITASSMNAVARTSKAMPSQSLIKRICYPKAHSFSTAATRYSVLQL